MVTCALGLFKSTSVCSTCHNNNKRTERRTRLESAFAAMTQFTTPSRNSSQSQQRKVLTMKCSTHHREGIRLAIVLLIIPFAGLEATGFSIQQQQHHRRMQPQQTSSLYHQFHSGNSGGLAGGGGYPADLAVTPFIEPVKYNTTVFVGQTAYLPCVVKHLGDKTVSWIRKKDLHILTSGNHIYTSDPRVSLLREGKLLNSWILKLSSVKKIDEGSYECQVNVEPKMTTTLHLIVLGSVGDEQSGAVALGMLDFPQHQRDSSLDSFSKGYEARVLGPKHVQVQQGHTANLTCLVSHGGPSPNITWFLNDIPLEKTTNTRGGINIETEKSPFSTVSKLVIVRVDRRDEGKYSCGGISVYPDHVVLRVLPFHARSEDGSDEAIPLMVSVASSSTRVIASPMMSLPFLFSLLLLSPLAQVGSTTHLQFFSFPSGRLLSEFSDNLGRQSASILLAQYIKTFDCIHSLISHTYFSIK